MRRFAPALLLLVAGPLVAQQNVTARLDGRVPAAVAAAVRALADTAAARGLPADPLVDKAIEGSAKAVPAERIVAAVRLVLAQLDAAAGAIRLGRVAIPDAETIEAGAFALAAGLTGPQVTALVQLSTAPYTPAATLRVAGTLAALGVPGTQTVELISETIRNGHAIADLAGLPGRVQAQMGRGQTPAQAAAGLARAAAARAAAPGQSRPRGPENSRRP